ncbi:MAG: DUF2269 family protein [Gemmatimonadales bacterium]|nr:DUF2269 family protein [Gemmatimonadales bacterium]
MTTMVLLKLVHIAAAILLLGNVVVTGFWAIFLYRVRDAVPFKPVARAIMWADWIFTVGGGTLLTFTGIQLMLREGLQLGQQRWLQHGIGALAVSTLLWLVVLLPDQLRMERIGPGEGERLRSLFLRWSVVGWFSTALLFYALWAMVTRR